MTALMGICNLTPDSFSGDGALGLTLKLQISYVEQLVLAGASVIDIGAESTRPCASVLTAEQEWGRLEPLVKYLGANPIGAEISIDTYHPENAVRALDYGVHWINDVSAGEAMLRAVQPYDCKLVWMHSLSVPANPQKILPSDRDPVESILKWGDEQLGLAESMGISRNRMILDPGIGFGKTAEQSWDLLKRIEAFEHWKVPVLVGHSRKSYLTELCGEGACCDAATVSVSVFLALRSVPYLRVHNVKAHADMLKVMGRLL